MRWEHLWIKLALAVEKSTLVRIVETSGRLAWSAADGTLYQYDPMPFSSHATINMQQGGSRSSSPPHDRWLHAHVWAAGLNQLGGEGWELVSVVPLTGDARITAEFVSREGRHDVQLWLFKRWREAAEAAPVIDTDDKDRDE